MPKSLSRGRLPVGIVVVSLLASTWQTAWAQPPRGRGRMGPGAPAAATPGTAARPGQLKRYAEVITPEAKTKQGVFTVHQVDDKVYFEIPPDAYGKLMLWSMEMVKAPAGVGWGGSALGHSFIKWERRGNKIHLWQVNFDKRADGKAVQKAVDSAAMNTIVGTFNVEAEGRDRAPVIDVTSLFTSSSTELFPSRLGSPDPSRSYVEDVKAFPTNIETRSLLTFRSSPGGAAPPIPGAGPRGGGQAHGSVVIHYSMTVLPDRPMQGRYFDPRVGYFTESFEDYASNRNWVEEKQYIARYRLEKKDPAAAVSEPVKPIVFYISREVPEKWRSYIKKGVEAWQPVFEKAGFKNAIQCKEAPSELDDPSWDPEDARYSVLRWVALPTQNAMGPHVHDPRSGEIISAHIIIWHDVLKLVQEWYFVQCGALDAKAQKLPLPESLLGSLLQMVVTHEVGHTLGLRHNHRASSAYTVAQLRDPKFTAEHGTTSSIMSYGRFNYVAQPEDKVTSLIPKLGPYDYFVIEWGYKPIAGAANPEAELPELDRMASRQMKEPWLRFGGEDGPAMVDPTVKTENIGADPIEATALGLKNLDRVADLLIAATTKPGEDESLLRDTYQNMLSHRARWLNSVVMMVGGVVENRSQGHAAENFSRLPKEKQQAAVKFLVEQGLCVPKKLVQPSLVNRFKYIAVADDVMSQQRAVLAALLSARRFQLLTDAEVLNPGKCYTGMELFTDVQNGVWSELAEAHPAVEVCRRNLQRAYLDHVKSQLGSSTPEVAALPGRRGGQFQAIMSAGRNTDFRAIARAELQDLSKRLDTAIQKTEDPITKVHLQDSKKEIELILNPKG
jgi:hypothetical protein